MKFDLKKAIITLKDGTATPVTLGINVAEGTLTLGMKRNIEYVKDRGNLSSTREGDQEPMDVKLDILLEHLKGSGSVKTPYDFLTKTGTGSALVSSGNDCEPYAVDIEVVYTPSCTGETAETILIQDYRWESLDADLKAGTLTTSGKANVTLPTLTRAA